MKENLESCLSLPGGLISTGVKSYSIFPRPFSRENPNEVLFSQNELERLLDAAARGLFAAGLTDTDRVANLSASRAPSLAAFHSQQFLQQYGCLNLPLSELGDANDKLKAFEINCVMGNLSDLVLFFRKLGEYSIEKVFFTGAMVSDWQEALQNISGAEIVRAATYGNAETWHLGYQCEHTPLNTFHAHDDECALDILDEKTQAPVSVGRAGTLFVTAFVRRLTPVIRYNTKETARWLPEKCQCGRTTPLFEVLAANTELTPLM